MSDSTVAVYMPDLSSGGIERMHINLAPALIKAGYKVIFLLHRSQGALIEQVPENVRIVALGHRRTLTCILPLIRFLKRERPAFLLSNLGHNNIAAIFAAMWSGSETKVIASYHRALSAEANISFGWKYRLLPLLCRFFLPYADGIVAVSRGVAQDLAKCSGLNADRIKVIYNPVVFDNFEEQMSAPCTHPWLAHDAPPFILGVGRLVEQKDFGLLISAFALLKNPGNLRLLLLGEGPLRARLEQMARDLGVTDRFCIAGYHSNPLPFMHKAKAVVMSSAYEGFGNVLVEALACGTPVVSTDCPYGPAEILEKGRYGKLVPVGNEKALARAIVETLANPLPSEVLRARGYNFTVARSVEGYVNLFKSFLRLPITSNSSNPAV